MGEQDLKDSVDRLMAEGRTGLACSGLGDDASGPAGIFEPDDVAVGAVTLPSSTTPLPVVWWNRGVWCW